MESKAWFLGRGSPGQIITTWAPKKVAEVQGLQGNLGW